MLSLSILITLLAQTPAPKPAAPSATPKATAPATAPASGTTRKATPATKAPAAKPSPAPMTDEQKVVYALGLIMQRSLTQFELSSAEFELVKRALNDGTAGKPAVDIDEWGPKVQTLARERAARVVVREKASAAAYLAKAATAPGAVKTDSGLIYSELTAGQGASPKATDTVKVHYRGTLTNGTEFDSSYKRGEPTQFSLNGVIKCWTEGLQKMQAGGKARLVCPSDLAYGDRGNQSIPGGAALIFDLELVEVVAPPQAPGAAR
jgi:FKBP-type peptidyl-prolyl cis-trans isomerase FkpA